MRLTKDEIALVVAVLVILVVGAAVRNFRRQQPATEPAAPVVQSATAAE